VRDVSRYIQKPRSLEVASVEVEQRHHRFLTWPVYLLLSLMIAIDQTTAPAFAQSTRPPVIVSLTTVSPVVALIPVS